MRKLVVAEFISLDGVVEAPDTWHFPYVNEEMFGVMWSLNAEVDTMLLGRLTYQSYAGAFANAPADDPVAAQMNRPAKVVVSKTLGDLEWTNSTLLAGDDIADGVAKLKQRPGAAILTTGSTRLARTLLRAGLVDELSLLVHPIVVGTGQRLFEDEGPRLPLELVTCTALSTGVVHAVYRTESGRSGG
jgi:dihydrofolate reductase